MRNNLFAHISLFIANLIYALNYTFAKDVMPEYIQPSGFILLRVTGAVLVFSIIYVIFIKEKIQRKDMLRIAICGLFGVAINQLLFFHGLNLSTPINAAIIMTINPILVALLSYIIIKEQFPAKKKYGIVLGISGAIFLILNGGQISLNNSTQLGNVFVFINASSYALYLVFVKPLMQKYNPISVMFFVFAFGLLFVLPFGYEELRIVNWDIMPKYIYYEIIFVVLFTTVIAYSLNSFALKTLNASTVSIYIYIQPVLATIFAVYMESDKLTLNKIIACGIIFLAVYLVSKQEINKQKLF